MLEWYKMAFEKYADFSSRSTRNEYWWFFLCNVLISIGLSMAGSIMAGILDAPIMALIASGIMMLYSLAILIPNLAVSVRRLHDTNRSGWFLLLALIPIIGGIILLIFFAQESDPNPNKWGPVPGRSDSMEDALVDIDDDIV